MKLFFRKYGTGQPLIILHGLFGQSDNWNTPGKRFAEQFGVYLVDLRNHGLSPHSTAWDYKAMSDDLLELIEDNRLQNPILLGHSLGGESGDAVCAGSSRPRAENDRGGYCPPGVCAATR